MFAKELHAPEVGGKQTGIIPKIFLHCNKSKELCNTERCSFLRKLRI